jgi:pimeloyl-ACP methyl ester carboxylesterase
VGWPTFVIVHGAWSCGHAWRWLRLLLRGAGHEVFPRALTGLGARSHLASAQVDLDTHVRDVLGVLEFEDLAQVVLLVGHRYGLGAYSSFPRQSAGSHLSCRSPTRSPCRRRGAPTILGGL